MRNTGARFVLCVIGLLLATSAMGVTSAYADPTPPPPAGSRSPLPPPEPMTDPVLRTPSSILTSVVPRLTTLAAPPANNRVVGALTVAGDVAVVTGSAATTLARVTSRQLSRSAGTDRYATAAAMARAGFPGSAATVYLATGENFPDGLAAGNAAGRVGGPLLLTRAGVLPSVTRQALIDLSPSHVVIVGGPDVVSDAVMAAVRDAAGPGATVERVAGANRYATAVALAQQVSATAPVAYLATGSNFPDALAAGAAATHRNGPLLLTPAAGLDADTRRALVALSPSVVYLAGGPDVVSDAVAQQVATATHAQVRRIAGANRYETAAALSRDAFSGTPPGMVLATGRSFADALGAGAYAATVKGPLLLDAGASVTPRTTTDEAVRLSWYVGTAADPVIRYVPIPHPDDEMASMSLLAPATGRYDVFVLLTRGEGSGYCTGKPVNNTWSSQQLIPQPQPLGLPYTPECAADRLDAYGRFLDTMNDQARTDPQGPVTRLVGVPVMVNGTAISRPTRLDAQGAAVSADYVDVSVGAHSARFTFDLGDGQLTPDKVVWAIENVRRHLDLLPTQNEGDIVAGGYVNTTNVGMPDSHPDHVAVRDALAGHDFGLPGSQYSPVGHSEPTAVFGATDTDYCAHMCHPADTSGFKGAMGTFQYAYGWLRSGRWSTGAVDAVSGFSQYQSFGKAF